MRANDLSVIQAGLLSQNVLEENYKNIQTHKPVSRYRFESCVSRVRSTNVNRSITASTADELHSPADRATKEARHPKLHNSAARPP